MTTFQTILLPLSPSQYPSLPPSTIDLFYLLSFSYFEFRFLTDVSEFT